MASISVNSSAHVLTLQSVNGANNPDWKQIADAFVNDNGQIQYKGRTIHYKSKGRIHSFSEPWVYDATAWDVESDTKARANHFEESEDASIAAFKKLIVKLEQKGILKEQAEERSKVDKDRQEDISQPKHTTQHNQPSNQPLPPTEEVHKEAQKDTNKGVTWGFLQYLSHETFSKNGDFVFGIFITSCFGIGIYIVILCWKPPNWQPHVHSGSRYTMAGRTTYHSRQPHDDFDDKTPQQPDSKQDIGRVISKLDSKNKTLLKAKRILCEHLKLDHRILHSMVAQEALTKHEVTKIKSKVTDSEQVEELIDMLLTKAERDYNIFMKLLKDKRPDLYRLVITTERKTEDK